jgi:hypothetical protein
VANEREDQWRREFEQWGCEAVQKTLWGACGWEVPRRQFVFRWLREKEQEAENRERDAERREQQMQQDTRRTLWLAVAAIVISVVSLFVSVMK